MLTYSERLSEDESIEESFEDDELKMRHDEQLTRGRC